MLSPLTHNIQAFVAMTPVAMPMDTTDSTLTLPYKESVNIPTHNDHPWLAVINSIPNSIHVDILNAIWSYLHPLQS